MSLRLISRAFTDVIGNTGSYPSGVALDASQVKYVIEYVSSLDLSEFTQVVKRGNRIRLVSGSWESQIACFKGANIDFNLGGATVTTTVDTVDGADLYLTSVGGYADGTYSVGTFTVTDSPVAFEHYVNLFQNSLKNGTKFSFIDGEVQWFKATLVNALSVAGIDTFIQNGFRSGGSIMTSTIERLSDVGGNKRYEITTDFRYWGALDSEIYKADDSVGVYTNIIATPLLNNTKSQVSLEDSIEGNIGFENEILNGGDSRYTFNSISWTDTSGNPLDAFDYTQECNFNIQIDAVTLGTDQFNFKFFRVPNISEYQNKRLPFDNNISLLSNDFIIDFVTPTNKTGLTNAEGAGFTMNSFNVVKSPAFATITGSITPNAAMITYMDGLNETDRGYKFWVSCQNSALSFENLDSDNVLCDEAIASKDILPLGIYTTSTFEFQDVAGNTLGSTPDLLSTDIVRLVSEFVLPRDTSVNRYNSITMKVVAVKNDGSEFDLESFEYDVSLLPAMRDGKLCLDYSVDRGFRIASTSDLNNITVALEPSLDDLSNFGVRVSYPFRIRNESWLPFPEASDDFYCDKTYNWFTYADDPDWSVEARIVLNTVDGIYTNPLDFNISGGLGGVTFEFQDLDLNVLTKPLSQDVTIVTARYTSPTDWNGGEYGEIVVWETDNQPIWTLNTIDVPTDTDNPLVPLAGETKLKITITGNLMELSCYFDPTKINPNDVTFGARFHGNTL